MRFIEIFFIALAIVATKAALNDVCDTCFHRNDCHIMHRYNEQQQQLWLMKYQCLKLYHDGTNNVYKFIPERGGDFVCCSKIVWEIENNMKNPTPNDLQGNSFRISTYPIYNQGSNGMTVWPNQFYYNNNQLPRVPYFPAEINNVPSNNNNQNLVQPCLLTSFPPKPDTECCGREATGSSRIAGSHNSPRIMDLANFPNSRMPQLNNQLTQNRRSGFTRNRRRRANLEEKVNITIGQRIAGGRETEFEQFPWTVLLKADFDYGNRQESFNCGGSLISSRYVLTAAHCLYSTNGTLTNVEVYLAEHNKQTFPTDCKYVLGVGQKCIQNLLIYGENFVLHPEYESTGLTNDIALIRLRGTAPYTDYIRPICILPIDLDRPEYLNLPLEVAGWGRNGPYRSDIKQSTVVNLVPQKECKQYYTALTTKHLCAVGHTGEDTCKGDSGGPLMTVYGGKYFVVGLVSGKRVDYPCGTSVPSLYTNVYNYIDWILYNIKN